MSEQEFLFTLHEDEEDFRIVGAVVAHSAHEAASLLGGEYVAIKDQPPDSSKNKDELNLHGRIRFAPELFRRLSDREIGLTGYDPGLIYRRRGFRLWERPNEDGRELVLRQHAVVLTRFV